MFHAVAPEQSGVPLVMFASMAQRWVAPASVQSCVTRCRLTGPPPAGHFALVALIVNSSRALVNVPAPTAARIAAVSAWTRIRLGPGGWTTNESRLPRELLLPLEMYVSRSIDVLSLTGGVDSGR